MIVVGGTYDEICFEPRWEEKFGSGLRACRAINGLNPDLELTFYTFGNENTILFLNQVSVVFSSIKSQVTEIDHPISFYYDHPLIIPRIYPRLDTIFKTKNTISLTGDDILYFGMIEGNATVSGKRVVYDPQSPSNPILFSDTGSTAEKLAIVVNFNEGSKLAKTKNISEIIDFFFTKENADVLVLKMGAKGALVTDKGSGSTETIPVYKTTAVWPIGSGDVFASIFAYNWFHGASPTEAANKASLLTALYCETKNFNFSGSTSNLKPLLINDLPKGKVYLAGPFFTYAQRWLIDQIRSALQSTGLSVFSPWHDIGHGIASDVVSKDLAGLEESELVFAVIDGLDSGTLFEVGYAVKKRIPVIAYVESETEESIKMLEGTGCILEKDLTTAIYKSFWILGENE